MKTKLPFTSSDLLPAFTADQIDLIMALLERFGSVYLVEFQGIVYLVPYHWKRLDARVTTIVSEAIRGLLPKLFKGKLKGQKALIYPI